jgi:hypothetical protein
LGNLGIKHAHPLRDIIVVSWDHTEYFVYSVLSQSATRVERHFWINSSVMRGSSNESVLAKSSNSFSIHLVLCALMPADAFNPMRWFIHGARTLL